MCYKEKIELLDRVMARGHRSAWFPLLSACRFVEFDTSIICHVLVYCFLLISIARYILKSPRICFWGTKYDVYRERVVYLHYILWRRARLWLEPFASTADKFFSRLLYLHSHVFLRRRRWFTSRKLYACLENCGRYRTICLPMHVFLRRCRRFTSRKLYACLEKFVCFLQLSDRAKFLKLDVHGSFSFDSSITTGFEINSYRYYVSQQERKRIKTIFKVFSSKALKVARFSRERFKKVLFARLLNSGISSWGHVIDTKVEYCFRCIPVFNYGSR